METRHATKHKFIIEEPRAMGGQLGVNQSVVDFAEFRRELQLELEHGVVPQRPMALRRLPARLPGPTSRNSQTLTHAGLTRSQSGSVPDNAKGKARQAWAST